MAQENLEVARELLDAFKRRDLPAAVDLIDPGAEFYAISSNGRERIYLGHDGVRQYLDDISQAGFELELLPQEYHEVGDYVVALGMVHARSAGDYLAESVAWVWKIERGKAVWGRVYTDPDEALAAMGLDE
jgi:ketosteroid isomerase-like protein